MGACLDYTLFSLQTIVWWSSVVMKRRRNLTSSPSCTAADDPLLRSWTPTSVSATSRLTSLDKWSHYLPLTLSYSLQWRQLWITSSKLLHFQQLKYLCFWGHTYYNIVYILEWSRLALRYSKERLVLIGTVACTDPACDWWHHSDQEWESPFTSSVWWSSCRWTWGARGRRVSLFPSTDPSSLPMVSWTTLRNICRSQHALSSTWTLLQLYVVKNQWFSELVLWSLSSMCI